MVSSGLSLLNCCALLLLMATNSFTQAKDAEPGTLVLSVFNNASVPAEILAQGELRAAYILSQAGIQVEWLNCPVKGLPVPDQFERPSLCSSIAYPSHLSVRILYMGKSVRGDIFGEAFTNSTGKGTHINLYYAHLAESGACRVLSEGALLGYVIAHEVGHLLLGTDSHFREGIMQGHWEKMQLRDAARGNLQFTPQQAASMRECLAGDLKRQEQHHSRDD
jgi:hypothetical protein